MDQPQFLLERRTSHLCDSDALHAVEAERCQHDLKRSTVSLQCGGGKLLAFQAYPILWLSRQYKLKCSRSGLAFSPQVAMEWCLPKSRQVLSAILSKTNPMRLISVVSAHHMIHVMNHIRIHLLECRRPRHTDPDRTMPRSRETLA
jgi:hypothetical protein